MRQLAIFLAIVISTTVAADEPRKIALLVGVSDYQSRQVDDLKFAENDIHVVGSQLKLMGFEVTSLAGKDATRKQTISTIDGFMEKASELESSDIVFVMFSGHGQQIRVRKETARGATVTEVPYFCPVDSKHFDETKTITRGKSETQVAEELNFVSLNRVLRGLDESSNSLNNLLVVDACRNNPSKGKAAGISGTSATVPRGVNILFAAGSGEKSWESADEKIQHGVFTYFLIKGLQGDAKNRYDQVTWSRLASYLQEEVAFSGAKLAGAKNRTQNPHSIINSTNLIVLGQPTSEEQIEKRLLLSLSKPNDVLDLAELCSDKDFVLAPVCSAMLSGDEKCAARAIEILRPHFRSPELLSMLSSGRATVPEEFRKIESIGYSISFSFKDEQYGILDAIEQLEGDPYSRYFRILIRSMVANHAYSGLLEDFDPNKFSDAQLKRLNQALLAAGSELRSVGKAEIPEIERPLLKEVKSEFEMALSSQQQYRKYDQLRKSGFSFSFNGENSSRVWKAQLGSQTYTRPATGQGKVFIGTNNGSGYRDGIPEDQDKGVLLCFDDKDGKFLWQLTRDKLESGRVNDWPLQGIVSQPCVEGDRLWCVTNRGEIMCLDTEGFHDEENDGSYKKEKLSTKQDADIIWSLDMIEELGVFSHLKFVGDPVIFEDILFVNTSNGVDQAGTDVPSPRSPTFLAVNKNTGEVVWEANQPFDQIMEGNWASPAVGIIEGVPQVYFPGGDGWLYAFHAKTGKLIWKFDLNLKEYVLDRYGRGDRNHTMARPVVYENSVILASGQNPEQGEGVGHLWRIDATKRGDISAEIGETGKKGRPNPNSGVIWQFGGKKGDDDYIFRRSMSSPVITSNGLLFISDLSGFFHCLDVKTGKKHSEYDLLSGIWASPVLLGDHLLLGDEDGILNVFEVDAQLSEPAPFYTKNYSSIYTTVHVDGDSVYVTCRDRLTKFDFSQE